MLSSMPSNGSMMKQATRPRGLQPSLQSGLLRHHPFTMHMKSAIVFLLPTNTTCPVLRCKLVTPFSGTATAHMAECKLISTPVEAIPLWHDVSYHHVMRC